jgi:hypothetical protein
MNTKLKIAIAGAAIGALGLVAAKIVEVVGKPIADAAVTQLTKPTGLELNGCRGTSSATSSGGIISPVRGSQVPQQAVVQGKLPTTPGQSAFVAVYAAGEQLWYVNPAKVADQTFSSTVYLGRPNADFNAAYDIAAFVMTDEQARQFEAKLGPGKTWPGKAEAAPGYLCTVTVKRAPSA